MTALLFLTTFETSTSDRSKTMNAMPRVTRLICPECKGEGYLRFNECRCRTCAGNGRVSVADAMHYGIHCRKTAEAMGPGPLRDPVRQELYLLADQIFETLGVVAPWRSHRSQSADPVMPVAITKTIKLRILDLWETELLTTEEIGRVCRIPEADVCRVLDAAGRGDD
ncbi:hypothetical protein [Martelella mediterranea]|uniref:Uncharacterized protein n=1 Tax=Martelella mediterranea TaxID=293089 RepID=A0A4R3NPV3_9HYPH|nr:hypothetical protein [Martelella mediterranea]TCT37273.1 hypothetical protein EDC90_101910 [Martelella mediterranea]